MVSDLVRTMIDIVIPNVIHYKIAVVCFDVSIKLNSIHLWGVSHQSIIKTLLKGHSYNKLHKRASQHIFPFVFYFI